jgi:hypothetical protein
MEAKDRSIVEIDDESTEYGAFILHRSHFTLRRLDLPDPIHSRGSRILIPNNRAAAASGYEEERAARRGARRRTSQDSPALGAGLRVV